MLEDVNGASEQGNSIQGKPVSIFGEKPAYTEKEWALIARGFNEMGRLAREKGMYFTVHHHMGTGVEAEQDPAKANPYEYAVMAREYIRRAAGLYTMCLPIVLKT